jgi:hypothetical protein
MLAPMAASERRASRRFTGKDRDIANAPEGFRAPAFNGDEWRTRRLSCATIVPPNEWRGKGLIEESDSLVVAAAQCQGCALLLSDDMQDGLTVGGVTIRNPFTLTAGEARAIFKVAPGPVHRHRPRGRPKQT